MQLALNDSGFAAAQLAELQRIVPQIMWNNLLSPNALTNPVPGGANIPVASLPTIASPTVLGNFSGSPAQASQTALTVLAAALQPLLTGGGGNGLSFRPTTAFTTIPISTTRGQSGVVQIPGGLLGPRGELHLYAMAQKSGTTDLTTFFFQLTDMTVGNNLQQIGFSAANRYGMMHAILQGNGTDQSSIVVQSVSSVFAEGNVSLAPATKTVDTSQPWNILVGATTLTNDTATFGHLLAVIFNPDANSPVAWQTITPNVDGVTTVALDYTKGVNITIAAIPGAAQPVGVIANIPDGADFEIDLDNGGFSGVWPTYSAASPTVMGYTWMGGGGAVTTTGDTTTVIPIFGKRKGFELRVQPGYPVTKP